MLSTVDASQKISPKKSAKDKPVFTLCQQGLTGSGALAALRVTKSKIREGSGDGIDQPDPDLGDIQEVAPNREVLLEACRACTS
jgi:hypothetical protein